MAANKSTKLAVRNTMTLTAPVANRSITRTGSTSVTKLPGAVNGKYTHCADCKQADSHLVAFSFPGYDGTPKIKYICAPCYPKAVAKLARFMEAQAAVVLGQAKLNDPNNKPARQMTQTGSTGLARRKG